MRVVILREGTEKTVKRGNSFTLRVVYCRSKNKYFSGGFNSMGFDGERYNTIYIVRQPHFFMNVRIFIHEVLHWLNCIMWKDDAIDNWIDSQRFL